MFFAKFGTTDTNNLSVAKAYIDQLERSKSLPATDVFKMREAITKAEDSNMKRKDVKKLRKFSKSLKKMAKKTEDAKDSARLNALAQVLNRPSS